LTKTIKKSIGTLGYFSKQKQIFPEFIIDKDVKPFFRKIVGDEARFTQIF
jgi:hypothetical protein